MYVFAIYRAAPDVTNITLAPLTNSVGYEPSPWLTSLVYAPRTMSYDVSIPLVMRALLLTTVFSTASSMAMSVAPSGQSALALVSGTQLVDEIPLDIGGSIVLTLLSTQDGVYTINITRRLADVTLLLLSAYDSLGLSTTLTITPQFNRTTGIYNYTASHPFGSIATDLSVSTISLSSLNCVTIENGGAPKSLDFPGPNSLWMENVLDGQYRFTLVRDPPDILGVLFQLSTGAILIDCAYVIPVITPAWLYAGESTGPTVNQTFRSFTSTDRVYSPILIPFIHSNITIELLKMTVGGVTSISSLPFGRGTDFFTTGTTTATIVRPLAVGPNLITLGSSTDGQWRNS